MVIPPATFGDQRRAIYSLRLSEPGEVITRIDGFENTVLDVHIPSVERGIEFEAWIMLERMGLPVPRALSAEWLRSPRLLEATGRTATSPGIDRAADELRLSGAEGLTLAELANAWVHQAMTYTRGMTGVATTGAEALAAGGGVCQDYSHVMIALCRLLGIPALYVSGHQLGEGGTHAWVEVLLPAADGSGRAEAWALDPTHGCAADLTYLTVAVGRDYGDVAPTSGSYRAGHGGSLTSYKEVLVTDVEYSD
jgi:transglutaminase-like putative cysteine protease